MYVVELLSTDAEIKFHQNSKCHDGTCYSPWPWRWAARFINACESWSMRR
jgi:hypothetical protein